MVCSTVQTRGRARSVVNVALLTIFTRATSDPDLRVRVCNGHRFCFLYRRSTLERALFVSALASQLVCRVDPIGVSAPRQIGEGLENAMQDEQGTRHGARISDTRYGLSCQMDGQRTDLTFRVASLRPWPKVVRVHVFLRHESHTIPVRSR